VKATVTILWPKMLVHHVSRGLAQTDAITAPVRCVLAAGAFFDFEVSIDKTPVREQGDPFHWMVDACVASTSGNVMPYLISRLPPEPCKVAFNFHDGLYMDVAAIEAPTEISLADGRFGGGLMKYAECKSRWTKPGLWTVDAVESRMECEVQ
jgi:hypothetical protein